MSVLRLAACWFLVSLCLVACDPAEDPPGIPVADPVVFREEVYPVLLADCAFPACHGDPDRFLAVYGPGRTRLSPETLPYDPPTPEELAFSFTRARSMLLSEEGVRQSPFLRKPLAVSAGGAGHEGDDPWGRAIFASKSDHRFQALFFWAAMSEQGGEP